MRLRGINYRVCGVCSPEHRSDVYCFMLNFKIMKLGFYCRGWSKRGVCATVSENFLFAQKCLNKIRLRLVYLFFLVCVCGLA